VTNDERMQKYAEAMYGDGVALDGEGPYDDLVRSAMAVSEADQAELRAALAAAVEHVKTFCHEAFVRGERAEAAEAKVARVEALADEWEGLVGDFLRRGHCRHEYAAQRRYLTSRIEEVRAALDGDA